MISHLLRIKGTLEWPISGQILLVPEPSLVPLAVALPIFFFLSCLAQGFFILMTLENGWNKGSGNMWQELQDARKWVWVIRGEWGVAAVSAGLGSFFCH